MKHNPLFVDSTKFRGERINSEIEIRGVQLREGESLQTRVIFADGRVQTLNLEKLEAQRFGGAIRLSYLEQLTFQHQVIFNGAIVDQSEERKFVANYTVMERWVRKVEELAEEYIEETSFEDLERELKSSAMKNMDSGEEDDEEISVPKPTKAKKGIGSSETSDPIAFERPPLFDSATFATLDELIDVFSEKPAAAKNIATQELSQQEGIQNDQDLDSDHLGNADLENSDSMARARESGSLTDGAPSISFGERPDEDLEVSENLSFVKDFDGDSLVQTKDSLSDQVSIQIADQVRRPLANPFGAPIQENSNVQRTILNADLESITEDEIDQMKSKLKDLLINRRDSSRFAPGTTSAVEALETFKSPMDEGGFKAETSSRGHRNENQGWSKPLPDLKTSGLEIEVQGEISKIASQAFITRNARMLKEGLDFFESDESSPESISAVTDTDEIVDFGQ
jgi:hypothetical protein